MQYLTSKRLLGAGLIAAVCSRALSHVNADDKIQPSELTVIPSKYSIDYFTRRWNIDVPARIKIGTKNFKMHSHKVNNSGEEDYDKPFTSSVYYKREGKPEEQLTIQLTVRLEPKDVRIPQLLSAQDFETNTQHQDSWKYLWYSGLTRDSSVSYGASKLESNEYSTASVYVDIIQDYKLVAIHTIPMDGNPTTAQREALDNASKRVWAPLTMAWATMSLVYTTLWRDLNRWIAAVEKDPKSYVKDGTLIVQPPVLRLTQEHLDKATKYATAAFEEKSTQWSVISDLKEIKDWKYE